MLIKAMISKCFWRSSLLDAIIWRVICLEYD
jgi:hypothetical protein